MNMKMGIQKWQWSMLLLVLSSPLLLNAMAIWLSIGTTGMLQLFRGTYKPANPNLPIASPAEILLGLLLIVIFLGCIIWLVIFVSNRAFFQRQWLLAKILETSFVALFVAKIFEIATGVFMPFVWLPQFGDYLGLPSSTFAITWSHWLILPATAIILFIAITLSRNKSLESKKIGETVNAL